MKLNTQNNFSSFWLGDTFQNKSLIEKDVDTKPGVDVIKLSSYQRAISNFVNIVTSKNIPVKFSQRGDSYTDGKVVTISAKLDDKLFDSSVGLALHEGSHILLSDFGFLRRLGSSIPKTFYELGASKGLSRDDTKMLVKSMLNYVEDRRIDDYIVSTSPGYKGYYLSMYNKYFHSKQIDKGLQTDEFKDLTTESYFFRVINLTNPNTDLDALPGLRDIWNTLDLRNISRLDSTGKAYKVAYDISKIIVNNLDVVDRQKRFDEIKKKINQMMNGSGGDMVDDFSKDRIKQSIERHQNNGYDVDKLLSDVADEVRYMPSQFQKAVDDMIQEMTQGMTEDEKSEVRKKLDRVFTKQKKFLEGKISKRKLSKKDINRVEAISESGSSYKDILKDKKYEDTMSRRFNTNGIKQCIVVKNLTQTLIDTEVYPNLLSRPGYYGSSTRQDLVNNGLRLGKMLGKKLQIRGEERLLKNTRLRSGRIDKRLVAELGFNNESVFHTINVDKYPDGFLHISLDASGSMHGDSFDNSLTCAIAIIQAVDMIPNFDVVFSLRGTSCRWSGGSDVPILLYAYDSRVDKISKVRNLFKYLTCSSTTPEGLCYEAIMDDMVHTTNDRESYFLNFSDGMPMYSNDAMYYQGDEARNHTRDMVKKMRNMRIKVLSYFISSRYNDNSEDDYAMNHFKQMYGSDAESIDILSIPAVARTMNNLFLKR